MFSASGDDLQHTKKKNKSLMAALVPQLGQQRRAKSGSRLADDSVKLGHRNNSLRSENMMKQLANVGTVNQETADRFKVFKAGKASQEVYTKTLRMANATLDRQDLNRSINKKHAVDSIVRERPLNTSHPAIALDKPKIGLIVKGIGKLDGGHQGGLLAGHKRTNTISDLLSKKLETRKPSNNDSRSLNKQSLLSQTQPLFGFKAKPVDPAQSKPADDRAVGHKGPGSRSTSATMKDKRPTTFYQERRGVVSSNGKDQESAIINMSMDSRKSRPSREVDGHRRAPPARVYHFLDNIRRFEPQLPIFEPAKTVVKEFDLVKAFSVNTHQGTVRAYNEDRVSILLNAQQRFDHLVTSKVKSCSMFAIYDGHGGADCCNFLKENLHSYILSNYSATDLRGAIKSSCSKLDADFFKRARTEHYCDTSGSCALALLVIGKIA